MTGYRPSVYSSTSTRENYSKQKCGDLTLSAYSSFQLWYHMPLLWNREVRKIFKKITITIELSKKNPYSECWKKVYIIERVDIAQCGILGFFLSPRFYVKSILENLEVLKLPVLPFQGPGALNFINLVNFSLQKVQKFIDIKIQSLWIC